MARDAVIYCRSARKRLSHAARCEARNEQGSWRKSHGQRMGCRGFVVAVRKSGRILTHLARFLRSSTSSRSPLQKQMDLSPFLSCPFPVLSPFLSCPFPVPVRLCRTERRVTRHFQARFPTEYRVVPAEPRCADCWASPSVAVPPARMTCSVHRARGTGSRSTRSDSTSNTPPGPEGRPCHVNARR